MQLYVAYIQCVAHLCALLNVALFKRVPPASSLRELRIPFGLHLGREFNSLRELRHGFGHMEDRIQEAAIRRGSVDDFSHYELQVLCHYDLRWRSSWS
jgi:hypothetical protein